MPEVLVFWRWLKRATSLLIVVVAMCVGVASVQAAEVLQVRSSSLLQVGDHNRNYTVQLACLEVPAEQQFGVNIIKLVL